MAKRAGSRRGAEGRGTPRHGMAKRRGVLVPAVLFVSLGLVAAFLVSAIAGLRVTADDEAAVGADPLGDGAALTLPGSVPVRIEVLNGSGKPGMARAATDHLRERGFDVVFYGNASRFDHQRSVVLDRVGDQRRARAAALALGIDSVATDLDAVLLLDVTVVLGADWPPPPPPPATVSDRLRRLLAPSGAEAP